MGAGGIARANLVAALRTDKHQFCAAGRAGGVVLADHCPAVRAERLSTGGTFRRAGRHASATARAGGSTRLTAGRVRLELAAGAGTFLGEEHQAALRAEARPTRGAGALRRQKPGAADGTDCPAHEHCPNAPGYASGRRAFLVGHRLPAAGTAVWGAEERFAAGRAAPAEDQPAVGADRSSGQEFHAARGAGERQFQAAVGAPFSVFVHGRAAARAEGMPAGRTGRVAKVDPGSTPGAGRAVRLLSLQPWLGPALIFGLLGPRVAFEDKAAVGTDCVGWGDLPVAARAGQRPGLTADRAGRVVRTDERAAGRAQVGTTVGAEIRFRFDRAATTGAVRHRQAPVR
jgi:hypothetical protein